MATLVTTSIAAFIGLLIGYILGFIHQQNNWRELLNDHKLAMARLTSDRDSYQYSANGYSRVLKELTKADNTKYTQTIAQTALRTRGDL